MTDVRESVRATTLQCTPPSFPFEMSRVVFSSPLPAQQCGRFTTAFSRITSRSYWQNSRVHGIIARSSPTCNAHRTAYNAAHNTLPHCPLAGRSHSTLSLSHTYIQTHNNHQHQKHPHNVYSLFDTKEGLNPMCIVLGESDWVRLYSETTNITKSIPINNQQWSCQYVGGNQSRSRQHM